MRKKKEIVSAINKRGRPRNSGLIVPSWAGKAVTELSAKSGVTAQKILEVALRDGIQLVGEPLGAWINYQKSAENQFNEHITRLAADHRKEPGPPADTAIDDIELEPDELGTEEAIANRLDDAGELPGLGSEVYADNGTDEPVAGD